MSVKYVADITGVREVTVVGTADLAYWRQSLQPLGYAPLEIEGAAQLIVSGTDARFKGIPFREVSMAVRIEPVSDSPAEHSFYFLQAFNSCRCFAFVERRMFSTPYLHGEVETKVDLPARVQLREGEKTLLTLEMASLGSPRIPASTGMDGWNGALFLPPKKRDPAAVRRWFLAKISGETESYPFEPASDVWKVQATAQIPALGWLGESGFMPRTWMLRKSAAHAKSETYVAGTRRVPTA